MLDKLTVKISGAIGTVLIVWFMWGDDIVEHFPIVSEVCDRIGFDFCVSAERLQEDEVLIDDEAVEI